MYEPFCFSYKNQKWFILWKFPSMQNACIRYTYKAKPLPLFLKLKIEGSD